MIAVWSDRVMANEIKDIGERSSGERRLPLAVVAVAVAAALSPL